MNKELMVALAQSMAAAEKDEAGTDVPKKAQLGLVGAAVSVVIAFALKVGVVALILHVVGWATIYALEGAGAEVAPQPWWGAMVIGALVTFLSGRPRATQRG